jgi:hypothetical protein
MQDLPSIKLQTWLKHWRVVDRIHGCSPL